MITETAAIPTRPIRAGRVLSRDEHEAVKRAMMLDACKWDPQIGDICAIADFPLLISTDAWSELAATAEALTEELVSAERELLHHPELFRLLGMPRSLCRLLSQAPRVGESPAAARCLRYDFHWTDDGWRISEVNSDVPGGYSEGSKLPELMASHMPGTRPAGDPGHAWIGALAPVLHEGDSVALLSAPGFIEDQQVLAYFERLLRTCGYQVAWLAPEDLLWREGWATTAPEGRSIGAIVRFYQAEWLNLRRSSPLLLGGRTPVVNPARAVLSESKRFPLTWDELGLPMPTWRQLLPETRDPRDAPWRNDDGWLLKSAYCNTGDTVLIRSLLTARQWSRATRAARWNPGGWVAQRRFRAVPVPSPIGDVFPCVGVFVINGMAAGIYGRMSASPLINYAAIDVAVLVEEGVNSRE